jgi:serine/threonine-protein kinase
MADRPPDEVLAQLLLKAGFVTEAELRRAIEAQAKSAAQGAPLPLGDVLVQQGLLTAAQREKAEKKLEVQRDEAKRLGPYRILKKLGEGGMGAVYLAEDPASGQKVALKVLPKVAAQEEEAVRRFMREVDYARKLEHPNIVKAGAGGQDKGFHYYVMEYVEGETLGAHLQRTEFLAAAEASSVVLQVALGLKYAHAEGFIHRDIKPDNVIVSKDGVAKILDMGLSKNIEEAQTFRTMTGVALGTPQYIAPEQARGEKGIDGRADIYSLGATYYHLVTGETPFHGTTAIELIAQHLDQQMPDPRDIRDGIPDGVVHVIRKMMAKKPEDRYRDCAELVTDLELVLGGRNPSSRVLEAAQSAVALPMAREARERYRAQRRGHRPGAYRARTNSSSAPLILGGIVGAILLAVVLAVAMGGGSSPAAGPTVAWKEPDPKPARPHGSDKPATPASRPEELRAEDAQRKQDEIGPATGPKGRPHLDLGGGVRLELVPIKPGTFTMGGTQAPGADWQADDRPEHKVTITKGYFLGKYEVTRGQFAAFVGATGYQTDAERVGKAWGRPPSGGWAEIPELSWKNPNFPQTDDHPVMCITWNDAKAFCDWATKKTGRTVRLPSEAEWEYACRAGTKTAWSFGNDGNALSDYGWFDQNSGGATHPGGEKKPNAWGLYDMHGNVWEWCQDWAGPYAAGDAADPTGPSSGDRRVLRGGDWSTEAACARSAFRDRLPPSHPCTNYGFRVAVP